MPFDYVQDKKYYDRSQTGQTNASNKYVSIDSYLNKNPSLQQQQQPRNNTSAYLAKYIDSVGTKLSR